MNVVNPVSQYRDDMARRIVAINYSDLVALKKKVTGSGWGFNPQTVYPHNKGRKIWLANYLSEHCDHAKLEQALPEFEVAAQNSAKRNPFAKPTTNNPPVVHVEDAPIPEAGTASYAADPLTRSIIEALEAAGWKPQGNAGTDTDTVQAMIDAAIEKAKLPRQTEVTVKAYDNPPVNVGVQHKLFPRLLRYVSSGFPVWLPGPAGSGKTTAIFNAAKALGAEVFMPTDGPIDNKYDLTGFNNAAGEYVEVTLYRCFKYAEANPEKLVFFFIDEVDSCYPNALLTLNAAMENGHFTFPNGERLAVGKNVRFLGAANTYGNGATHEYVGRNKIDASTLDRFIMLSWEYDEELERALAGNDGWCAKVQRIRRAVAAKGIKHVVSPRASIRGAKLLAMGEPEREVLDAVVYKGLTPDQVRSIEGAM